MTTLESPSERLADALRRLAVEAADLFEELLASGAELPFEIEPSDGGPLPMYSYAPQTSDFIRSHVAELRRLEAFVEVRDLTSEEVAVGFLVGLWDGRGEFEIAGDRLEGAIDGALAMAGSDPDATPAGEVIVPLIGFHMPATELELDGVRIVRADSVPDAPVDAIDATRPGGGKPGFLAVVSCGWAGVAPNAAVADDLQRMLRTLRLFRPGAVALSAHGWVRRADGWERFGTGAGRARNGGYRLTGSEVGELKDFSRKLAERGARMPALAWALSRFDLGAERSSLIEAVSDYLLALRGLLEGGGPARAGITTRLAALVCEPPEREAARVCIERALRIERQLMGGARYRPAAGASPLAVIAELEELLRRLLKRMATGDLGGDMRAAADEILLTEGLAGAEPASSADETAEWRLPDPVGEEDDEFDLAAVADGNVGEIEIRRVGDDEAGPVAAVAHEPDQDDPTTRIIVTDVELPEIMGADDERPAAREPDSRGDRERVFEPAPEPSAKADWFEAAGGELEWPAFASPRRGRDADERPAEPSDRVRYLFPVPDATDWDIGELRYERKRAN